MSSTRLTRKDIAFVDNYLTNGFNASDAVRKAGYRCLNDNVAGVRGHRLLKKDKVIALIEERTKVIQEKYRVTRERVIKDLIDLYEHPDTKSSDKVQIARLLGLNLGMFRENTQIVQGVFTQLNQRQLVKTTEEGRQVTNIP